MPVEPLDALPGRFTVFDDAALDRIEAGADRVLAETGLRFEDDPETLALWRQAGAAVDGDRVRLDGPRLREIIRATAPAHFVLHGRNPARSTRIGAGEPPVLAPVYGPPNVLREDGSGGFGTRADYHRLVAMAHAAPGLANTGHMLCVIADVPDAARPLEMAIAHLTLSDKPFMGTIASPAAMRQVIDAAATAIGPLDGKPAGCHLLHLINATPPLSYKGNPLKCLRLAAESRQGCLITSYMMMGATGPVTVAGALIQGYAEVLAGLALAQLWRPGTPMIMGIFAMPFSMRGMVPVFGDPALHLVQYGAMALARRLGIPGRGDGGVTSSRLDDAQAGSDGGRATAAALACGADFILHAAGWLGSGRCTGIAKFRREAEALTVATGAALAGLEPPLPLDPALAAELRRQADLAAK
ncbi:trimethylamine methyltransferase family protein [Inquilinus sp. Marseille-Q2685]|uniref:trimethylamine methyltransferase family protein n=1 Tax=Inquilinus sp. Marseille-Q2685 TaxID=2866581 RepID=UPI001CE49C5E|nr:trimethylamine methyltransferase family protein [Inquilinus sp. Marseille-Q2685]